jgi:hypothetical protein
MVRDRSDEIVVRPKAHRTRGSTASETAG